MEHPCCEKCKLTDRQVRFKRKGLCETCYQVAYRGQTPHPERRRQKPNPDEHYCPVCSRWKKDDVELCQKHWGLAWYKSKSVCRCGGRKSWGAYCCMECRLEARAEARHCVLGDESCVERFPTVDYCQRHYSMARRLNLVGEDPSVDREPDLVVVPAELSPYIAARRRRLAAQGAQAPRQSPRSGPVGTRRAAA